MSERGDREMVRGGWRFAAAMDSLDRRTRPKDDGLTDRHTWADGLAGGRSRSTEGINLRSQINQLKVYI